MLLHFYRNVTTLSQKEYICGDFLFVSSRYALESNDKNVKKSKFEVL